MQIFRAQNEVPADWGPSVVAIGSFDGVHCGHQAILRDVLATARATGSRSVAVSFHPHPLEVLRPADAPQLLTPLPHRLEVLAQSGLDATLILPFTPEFAQQSAESFAGSVLRDTLRATAVHEGDNFRFGYGAEAGVERLRELGLEMGFSVISHQLLRLRGLPVSSSQIRSLVTAGRVSQARALLGRSFSIVSAPARGRGIGTKLLVPTINLAPYAGVKPAHGVYVSCLRVGQGDTARWFRGITNAGNRPTFGEDSYAIESHLFDFETIDLSDDTPLELVFLKHLRSEQRFASPEALRAQIGHDIQRAQRYHALAGRLTR